MDGMVALKTPPKAEWPRLRVRETLMSPDEIEAAQILHSKYSKLDITVISKPEQAAGEIISALPGLSPHENLLRKLAAELGQEVLKHPNAKDGQLFTLHLRNVDIDSEDVLPTVGNSITRLVALPVGSTTSPRGNMMPDDVTAFCDNWAETANQDVLLFTAYPSFIEESQLIDPEQERQILSEKQVLRLRAIQGKMLAEAQAASMQSLEAQTALIGTLGHLRSMGAQIGAYRQIAKKSKSDDPNRKTELTQASQSIRNESRALAASLKKDAMNGMLSPQLRETLRAGLKELRATGVLSEKHAPKIIATPRLKAASSSNLAKSLTSAKIIPLHKAAAQTGRPIVSKAVLTDTANLKGKAGLVRLTKAELKKDVATSLRTESKPVAAAEAKGAKVGSAIIIDFRKASEQIKGNREGASPALRTAATAAIVAVIETRPEIKARSESVSKVETVSNADTTAKSSDAKAIQGKTVAGSKAEGTVAATESAAKVDAAPAKSEKTGVTAPASKAEATAKSEPVSKADAPGAKGETFVKTDASVAKADQTGKAEVLAQGEVQAKGEATAKVDAASATKAEAPAKAGDAAVQAKTEPAAKAEQAGKAEVAAKGEVQIKGESTAKTDAPVAKGETATKTEPAAKSGEAAPQTKGENSTQPNSETTAKADTATAKTETSAKAGDTAAAQAKAEPAVKTEAAAKAEPTTKSGEAAPQAKGEAPAQPNNEAKAETSRSEAQKAAEVNRTAESLRTTEPPKTMETNRTTEAPRAAETTRTTEASRAETSRTTEQTRTAEAPKTSETVGTAETNRTTEAPRAAETSRTAEAPKATEATKTAETPRAAETPRTTEPPKAAETNRTVEAANAAEANRTGAGNPASQPVPPSYQPQAAAAAPADKTPTQQPVGAAEPIINSDRSNSSFFAAPSNPTNSGAANPSQAVDSQNANHTSNNPSPASNAPPPPNQTGKAADTTSIQTGDAAQNGIGSNQQARAEPIHTSDKPADPLPAKPVQPTEPIYREEDKSNQPQQNNTQPREEPKEPINQQYKEAAKEVGCPVCGSTSCAGHDLGKAEVAKDSKVVDFGFEDKDVKGQYKEAAKEVGCPICGSTSCAGHDLGNADSKTSRTMDMGTDFGFTDTTSSTARSQAANGSTTSFGQSQILSDFPAAAVPFGCPPGQCRCAERAATLNSGIHEAGFDDFTNG
jgi:colicin import membrane protein